MDVATKYVHRGMVQNEEGVLQSSLDTSLAARKDGRLIARAWGNLDLSNDTGDAWLPDGHGGRFSQIDFHFLYEQAFESAVLTMGLVSYNLPNGLEFPNGERGATAEVLLAYTAQLPPSLLKLEPTLEVHYDVDEVDGAYVRGSLARSFVLSEDWFADLAVGVAWMDENQAFWNYAQAPQTSGIADATLVGRVSYAVDRHTTVNFQAAYSDVVDSDFVDWFEVIGIEETQTWVSLGVSWSY